MASLKMSKGPIQINRGIDDMGAPVMIISAVLNPRIHLGGKHHIPVQLAEGDARITDADLSAEGQAHLKALVAEVEAKILEKARAKAQEVAAETNIKIEG